MTWFDWAKEYTGKQKAENSKFIFTPAATRALGLAGAEAKRLNHDYVATEHLLLGLIKLNEGVCVGVLRKLGLEPQTVCMKVENVVGTGVNHKMFGNIPYTPRSKKVIELAHKETKALNHACVGTEHLLLGLLAEGGGVAGKVLRSFDMDLDRTRKAILEELTPLLPPHDIAST